MSMNRMMVTPTEVVAFANPGANTAATATLPDPGAGNYWVITGYMISVNGQPAAAVQATLTVRGVALPMQIPAVASWPMPINMTRGMRANTGELPSLSVPALGAAISCAVWLMGFKVTG